MAQLLKGVEVCGDLKEKLREKNRGLMAQGVTPCLNIVRIGERPDDLSYEKGTIKRFGDLGIKVQVSAFPQDIPHGDFEKAFAKISGDANVHGILLFRPMPKQIDAEAICRIMDPAKDMDGICSENIAKVFSGDETGYAPCTPKAVMELLKHYKIPLKGKKVTLVGRSMVVGKPLAMLLLKENATITVCHTKTENMESECQKGDILIAAAGAAKMIKAAHVRKGTIVIDVGINMDEDGKLCGDVDFAEVEPLASQITPVPGGIGSITTYVLAMHLLTAAERSVKK